MYSNIHLKLIKFRTMSYSSPFYLSSQIYNHLKNLNLLKYKRRGVREGQSKFSCGNLCAKPCNLIELTNVSVGKFNYLNYVCREKNRPKRGVNLSNLITGKQIMKNSSFNGIASNRLSDMHSQPKLSVGIINTQSIRNKSDLINQTISDSKCDMCILTETWLTHSDDTHRVSVTPDSFVFLDSVRAEGGGGGTALIARQEFKPVKLDHVNDINFKSFEYAMYDLTIPNNDLSIVVIYRPLCNSFNLFISDFSNLMTHFIACPRKLLIAGDFNIHMNKSNDPNTKKTQ